jgi:hypothetical protein
MLNSEAAKAREGRLRFGAELSSISELAEQYYCEKKVELKRPYEEYCMAKDVGSVTSELMAKAYLYSMLINLQIDVRISR